MPLLADVVAGKSKANHRTFARMRAAIGNTNIQAAVRSERTKRSVMQTFRTFNPRHMEIRCIYTSQAREEQGDSREAT